MEAILGIAGTICCAMQPAFHLVVAGVDVEHQEHEHKCDRSNQEYHWHIKEEFSCESNDDSGDSDLLAQNNHQACPEPCKNDEYAEQDQPTSGRLFVSFAGSHRRIGIGSVL